MDGILDDLAESSKKLYEQHKFKEVEDMLTTFIREAEKENVDAKTKAKAFNMRGQARYKHGELDKAIEDYDHALRLDADLPEALFNRGTARNQAGQKQEALQDFERACQLDPENQSFLDAKKKCEEESK